MDLLYYRIGVSPGFWGLGSRRSRDTSRSYLKKPLMLESIWSCFDDEFNGAWTEANRKTTIFGIPWREISRGVRVDNDIILSPNYLKFYISYQRNKFRDTLIKNDSRKKKAVKLSLQKHQKYEKRESDVVYGNSQRMFFSLTIVSDSLFFQKSKPNI